MTSDEMRLLTDFLKQLGQVGAVAKDPQAAALIAEAAARQPDAAYLLVQRSLLQDQALSNATARIASLEAQVRNAPAGGGGFLDVGNNAWGRAATVATPAAVVAPTAATATAGQPYASAPAPSRFFGGGGGGSSFLTNMAATAAGVAGGAFLFQGIENLMGHHGSAGHLMDQQAPFGGMADSVDRVGAGTPSARNDLVDTPTPAESNDVLDSQVAADDSDTGSDDGLA